MIRPAESEMLVRAVALYGPIVAIVALALYRRPPRARITGALVATAWNVPSLLALNVIAVRAGWWSFHSDTAMVAGVPADLWLGWALLWGAVPILATTKRLVVTGIVLVAADLVLMPAGEPVLMLGQPWLVGELLAIATCLVPGLLLGRWTAEHEHVNRRAVMQVVAFAGLLFFVLPCLVFAATGESWAPLLERPRWQLVAAMVLLAPVGAMAIQAVREFAAHGGTPVPLDPPASLVTTGPYAYVANPMQLAATIMLFAWGLLLASPAVVAAAVMAAIFSAGLAAWSEDNELSARFGDDWWRYRRQVRHWLPWWRPAIERPGVVYVAATCDPCNTVGAFLQRRNRIGLEIQPAEECDEPLRRITYLSGAHRSTGIAAIGRGLEHVHLGWAAASWIGRLPLVEQVLQLITDAVGGGPRDLERRPGPVSRSECRREMPASLPRQLGPMEPCPCSACRSLRCVSGGVDNATPT